MNINALANSCTRLVNGNVTCDIYKSSGHTVDDAGFMKPTFQKVTDKGCQVQPVSSDNLAMVDALNIQGQFREIYVNFDLADPDSPELATVERAGQKGGDIIFYNSRWWKVVRMLEKWDTASWCHAVMVEQVLKDIKAIGLVQ